MFNYFKGSSVIIKHERCVLGGYDKGEDGCYQAVDCYEGDRASWV